MPMVEVPEVVVLNCGIPQRFTAYSLANLKKYKEYNDIYRNCCKYTKNLSTALTRGIGVCLFGPATNFRQYAFFGLAKAAIAQKKSVQILDVEDVIQAHSDGSPLYAACHKVDFLAIPEMDLPESVVNTYYKSIIFKLFKKRSASGKPTILGTTLEVIHPDASLDMLYPGIGQFIVSDTILMNFDFNNNCEWIRKGHKMKLSSLATLKGSMSPKVKEKTRLKIKTSAGVEG